MQLKRKLSDDESEGVSMPTRTDRDPPTPSSEDSTKPKLDRQPLRNVQVSFAVDISGSTYGNTLSAEKAFIKGVANLLAPQARFSSKILPWDNRAHPILSLGQVNSLEDSGGTDPGVLLTDRRHKAALKECSLWFLMTDGLIPPESRAKFARDVTAQGLHGISCVIVVFGNPKTGPSSCDISVGVGVFAVVPNCAFLFCDETTGDLRAMQTKGTFNALLKGQPHPVFDSSSRWDLLPQVSIADFATISIPDPQGLGADQVALQDSLVINMNDLFANRLSTDEINKIFDNGDNLDSIRLTMQARNQQEDFRHWLQQQAIRPDDPLVIPRRDIGHKAESLFGELVDLISRGQSPPDPLQARLRAAYRENMRGFIRRGEREHHNSEQRSEMITQAAFSSYTPTDASPALSPSTRGVNRYDRQVMGAGTVSAPVSALPRRLDWSNSELPSITPQAQIMSYPQVVPGAPPRSPPRRRDSGHASAIPYPPRYQPMEEPWGSWESKITNPNLRGLLYTTGLRSTKGSFKGTCPACGTKDITMAWLFRAPAPSTPFKPPTPGGTEGFPRPGSRTRLAFPLAMGHFTETSGVLASITPISTPITATSSSQSAQMPSLVCDPCSHFYTRNGALSFGITTALPLVRFSENREAICNILATAFNDRFDRGDLPQVFLSVLMLAADHAAAASTPRTQQFSPPSERDFDISATFKAAAALRTLRSAIEWAARDLLYCVVALRELSESFSLPSDTSGAVWPLATVLAGSFEELDAGLEGKAHSAAAVPLLRYPLPGFVTILKTAPLVGISEQTRRRAAFRRLLFLICEELEKAAGQVPHSQSIGEAFGGLLGRPHSVASTGKEGAKPETPWEPALSVSIQSLRFTSLLGAASYVMLSRTEEFRHLEEPLASAWAGSGLALFLHTLFAVVTKGGGPMKALDMFQDVMKVKLVASALQRPEEIGSDTVQEVLAQLL